MIPNESPYGNSSRASGFERLIVPLIVVLVGVAAFGLGRLSTTQPQSSSLMVHQEGEASTTPVSTVY